MMSWCTICKRERAMKVATKVIHDSETHVHGSCKKCGSKLQHIIGLGSGDKESQHL